MKRLFLVLIAPLLWVSFGSSSYAHERCYGPPYYECVHYHRYHPYYYGPYYHAYYRPYYHHPYYHHVYYRGGPYYYGPAPVVVVRP